MSSNLRIRQAVSLAVGAAGAAAATMGFAPLALAVDATGPDASAAPDAALQEVVVTGSRIRRVDVETANAVFVVDQTMIQDSGIQTVGDLVQRIPSVSGKGTTPNVNNGGGFGSSSVELRGLDARRTLVLVDGRRQGIVGDPSVSATDVNQIPLNLIDHIEVLKEGAGAIYGSDAVGGVVNFITLAPTAVPVLKLAAQGNHTGYRCADLTAGFSKGRWGFVLSSYYAGKKNGFLEYSDYHKGIFTARADYRFSEKTALSNSLTWLDYFSDMPGGIDSTMFAQHSFSNPQTFTYRNVYALRYHSTLTQAWNDHSKTTVSLLYRNNTIGQNPAYRIKDDYRRQGSAFTGKKDLAHGEINASSFQSYSWIAQHRQSFGWKKAVLIAGLNMDLSPSAYQADYIRIKKDTVTKKYTGYQATDSALTDYRTKLNNYAAFAHFDFHQRGLAFDAVAAQQPA